MGFWNMKRKEEWLRFKVQVAFLSFWECRNHSRTNKREGGVGRAMEFRDLES